MDNTREDWIMYLCDAIKAQTEDDIVAQSIMVHLIYAAYEHGRLDGMAEKSA